MSESPSPFELVEFEYVEAAPGTALLRVAARPSSATGAGPLTLVIHDGEREYRHPQLPALPGPPGLIRAAFSAPVDHVGRGVMFALEMPDGSTERLPTPSRRRSAVAGSTEAQGGAAGADPHGASAARRARAREVENSRLAEAERRAEARRLAVTELERRLQIERERRHASEADIARLRAEREQALADRDEAIADRDAAVADRDLAEARALIAATAAGTLEAQVRAGALVADQAREDLSAELLEKSDELERVRAAAEVAQARAHASRREVAELDEQLAHAQAQITVLEQALAERRSDDLQTFHSRIDSAHAELEVARLEIATLQGRISERDMTLAELDDVLSRRAAEIEVLRLSVGEHAERAAADAAARIGPQLALELEAAEIQAQELLSANASVDLLRAQAVCDREELAQARDALAASEGRASAADAALAELATDLEAFRAKVRKQTQLVDQSRRELQAAAGQTEAELERQRERADSLATELVELQAAASLAAEEVASAHEAATQARSEAESHKRHVGELSASLASAERTMHEASETISTHEADHREIKEALRAETERRVRAEEALLAASAERVLVAESVALEASAREQIEARAAHLSQERDRLKLQAETLFARIADEQARADAKADVLRLLS